MVPEALEDLLEEIEEIKGARDQFAFLIDLAPELIEIDPEKKNDASKLLGCASNAWLDIYEKDEKIYIAGDAEALISKGMLAFLSIGLSGQTKQTIHELPEKYLEKNILFEKLSPSRHNGALSAVKSIRNFCNQ